VQVVFDGVGADEELGAISRLGWPFPASRAIWVSRAVSWRHTGGAVADPLAVARSSRAARSAKPSAPMVASIWWAVRSCSRRRRAGSRGAAILVDEMGSGEVHCHPAAAELADRLW